MSSPKSLIKVATAGFVFGAFILPFITILGLSVPYLEYLKPLLSPGILAAQLFVVGLGDNMSYIPTLGWIAFGVVNGVLYSLVFTGIYFALRKPAA